MANEVRGYAKLVFTPSGGSAITIQGRTWTVNPTEGEETVELTTLDTTNHMIVHAGTERIKAGMSYTIGEIMELTKEVMDIVLGGNATSVPATKIPTGTATLTLHDRNDATSVPFLQHTTFNCQVRAENLEGGISDFSKLSLTVMVLGNGLGSYKIRGVPA